MFVYIHTCRIYMGINIKRFKALQSVCYTFKLCWLIASMWIENSSKNREENLVSKWDLALNLKFDDLFPSYTHNNIRLRSVLPRASVCSTKLFIYENSWNVLNTNQSLYYRYALFMKDFYKCNWEKCKSLSDIATICNDNPIIESVIMQNDDEFIVMKIPLQVCNKLTAESAHSINANSGESKKKLNEINFKVNFTLVRYFQCLDLLFSRINSPVMAER